MKLPHLKIVATVVGSLDSCMQLKCERSMAASLQLLVARMLLCCFDDQIAIHTENSSSSVCYLTILHRQAT